MKHEVKLINDIPVSGKEARNAVVSIDGKLHNVKVFYRRSWWRMDYLSPDIPANPDDFCQTWAVFRFDPSIKDNPDYKEIWKETFFALSLNFNDKANGLQREQKAAGQKKKSTKPLGPL